MRERLAQCLMSMLSPFLLPLCISLSLSLPLSLTLSIRFIISVLKNIGGTIKHPLRYNGTGQLILRLGKIYKLFLLSVLLKLDFLIPDINNGHSCLLIMLHTHTWSGTVQWGGHSGVNSKSKINYFNQMRLWLILLNCKLKIRAL